ncbi:MAG: HD domain-containing protein [Chloroflexota bacterium]|nr:HD domain-containing protein [Dehalococcoidia bacterium]MDW8254478.1 HD domain-containing protein [Chloroflexota bacterium]
MTLGRAVYRTRQFAAYTLGGWGKVDDASAVAALPPPLAALFRSMDAAARRHHLAVYRRLRARGCDTPEVLAAALLHDIGKGRVSPLERTAYVLASRVGPWLVRRLAGDGRRGWRALYRLAHHPAIGAALVQAAGGSERVVWLIANHQRRDVRDRDLQLLREADEAS